MHSFMYQSQRPTVCEISPSVTTPEASRAATRTSKSSSSSSTARRVASCRPSCQPVVLPSRELCSFRDVMTDEH